MSASLPSDEVAGDYKEALEDLITNDRHQIANLTMIAKENIEHAQAIARTLILHIKKAPPARKLPALYVLDSLVKNVGSPYTVYFGNGLHETFMLAYSQVDQNVRRKLEEMLKTWREPVPGSLSNTPVFPLTSTQSIYEALSRFRAGTGARPPQQQIRLPNMIQAQALQYRQTPTPQPPMSYQPPPINVQQPTPTPPPQPQPYYQQPPIPVSTPQLYSMPQQAAGPPRNYVQSPFPQIHYPQQNIQARTGIDLSKLHVDIDDLTTDAKIDCMTHPMDQAKSKKLETLQSLKAFLDSGNLGEQDLRDVRDTITKEMEKRNAEKLAAQSLNQIQPQQNPYALPTPQWQAPNGHQQNYATPYPQQSAYAPVQPPQQYQQPPPQTPAFLGQTNLAELLRKTQNEANSAQHYAIPASSTPTMASAVPAPSTGTMSLLDQIRASGILSKVATPQSNTPTMPFATPFTDDVPFTSAAIKIPRPHLVLKFMNEKPNQCSTCGRGFTSDDGGKAKKEKHLDWHFKTKTRSLEAEQRGQNRSWYVDEHEWIANKEYEDDLGLEEVVATTNGHAGASAAKKEQDFVRTPSDPAYRNATCPIDQEPFKSEWSADIQDFIWRDAVRVGDRYYHASCYREAIKAREALTAQPNRVGTPSSNMGHRRTATPDSILGKRKADDYEPGSASKSRLKVEV
ncbi:mRNA 3' end processing factor [Lithohypha guttulata]|uniref:mRNA 3' end processing factor n=1 Tax=Lithohypha guttulata TaxID=1690604 RepID=A0AAN7T5H2_9EURO|nr:mRNA 3' end processing factor [Lithohypha guttulata]KAK5089132.1 mRNA 3' end processing factor [Lithohypha guttulata]